MFKGILIPVTHFKFYGCIFIVVVVTVSCYLAVIAFGCSFHRENWFHWNYHEIDSKTSWIFFHRLFQLNKNLSAMICPSSTTNDCDVNWMTKIADILILFIGFDMKKKTVFDSTLPPKFYIIGILISCWSALFIEQRHFNSKRANFTLECSC